MYTAPTETTSVRQLNKQIKDIAKEIYRMSFENIDDYFKFIEDVAKPELKRLYYEDQTFESMNKDSILIMVRLNLTHKFITPHYFGNGIEIRSLI